MSFSSVTSKQWLVNQYWHKYHILRNHVLADDTTFIICDNVTRNRVSAVLCILRHNCLIFFQSNT